MPVPAGRFKCEMVIGREMTTQYSQQHNCQHDGAERYVRAVKSSQHKKRRTINSGTQAKTEFLESMLIFDDLQGQESEAQRYR